MRVLQSDFGLLDRLADKVLTRGGRARSRSVAALTGRHDRSLRQTQSIPVAKISSCVGAQQVHGSMSRVGACGDNAAMKSIFALLQRHVLDRKRWSTRAELRLALVTWIERTHHHRRLATRTRAAHPDRVRTAPHTGRHRGLKSTPRESTELGASPRSFGNGCVQLSSALIRRVHGSGDLRSLGGAKRVPGAKDACWGYRDFAEASMA